MGFENVLPRKVVSDQADGQIKESLDYSDTKRIKNIALQATSEQTIFDGIRNWLCLNSGFFVAKTKPLGSYGKPNRFEVLFYFHNLKRSLGKRFSVVHIASHFFLKPGAEHNPFLLLGDGSHLTLGDIRRTRMPFRGLDLVGLSACNMGMGGSRQSDVHEVGGFGTLVQKQDTKGVLATPWPVTDESTVIFMQNFYRLRGERNGTTKAEALRQAKMMFIRGKSVEGSKVKESKRANMTFAKRNETEKTDSFTPNPKAHFVHPHYWAPFILKGNWL